MYCRNCGKEIDDKAVVCVGCGVPPLKGTKYCQSCGKEVAEAAEVCVSCGVQLAHGSTAGGGDEKTWGMLAHLSMIVTWFIGPLVIYLTKGKEAEFVKDQAKEALNFSITCSIAFIALQVIWSVILAMFWSTLWGLGFLFSLLSFVLWIPWIAILVLAIMGGVQANSGTKYRYPFSIKFVK